MVSGQKMASDSGSVWLSSFNAELSPKRYWRGPNSQKLGEEGEICLTLHCHHRDDFCIWMSREENHLNAS